MKSFLQEYGLVLLSIIGVAFFFFVWSKLFHGEGGIDVVYKTWSPDTLALSGNNAVEKDSLANSNVPYFKVDDSASSNFILDSDTFTKADALEHVDAFYKGVEIPNNDITVLVYKYKPIMTPTDSGNINGHVKMTSDYTYNELLAFHESGNYTEVFATDKYGNYLYDVSGKHIVDEQPVYEVSKVHELTDSNYIDVSSVSEKYLVVYRVTKDSLKAECKKFFIKKSTTAGSGDPLEGFEKIEFDYDIDDSVQPLSVEGGEFSVTYGYSGRTSSGGTSNSSSTDVDESSDTNEKDSDNSSDDSDNDDSSGTSTDSEDTSEEKKSEDSTDSSDLDEGKSDDSEDESEKKSESSESSESKSDDSDKKDDSDESSNSTPDSSPESSSSSDESSSDSDNSSSSSSDSEDNSSSENDSTDSSESSANSDEN